MLLLCLCQDGDSGSFCVLLGRHTRDICASICNDQASTKRREHVLSVLKSIAHAANINKQPYIHGYMHTYIYIRICIQNTYTNPVCCFQTVGCAFSSVVCAWPSISAVRMCTHTQVVCLCMCICICIYYIYMYLFIYMYIYIYVDISKIAYLPTQKTFAANPSNLKQSKGTRPNDPTVDDINPALPIKRNINNFHSVGSLR